MTIAEQYRAFGVIHSAESCQICDMRRPVILTKSGKRKKLFSILLNGLLIAVLTIEFWIILFHFDWIIAGMPK
jgi:hypothetical protein